MINSIPISTSSVSIPPVNALADLHPSTSAQHGSIVLESKEMLLDPTTTITSKNNAPAMPSDMVSTVPLKRPFIMPSLSEDVDDDQVVNQQDEEVEDSTTETNNETLEGSPEASYSGDNNMSTEKPSSPGGDDEPYLPDTRPEFNIRAEGQKNRFTFTDQHNNILERVFEVDQYPSKPVKHRLSVLIGSTPVQVSNWFSRRRTKAALEAKEKTDKHASSEADLSDLQLMSAANSSMEDVVPEIKSAGRGVVTMEGLKELLGNFFAASSNTEGVVNEEDVKTKRPFVEIPLVRTIKELPTKQEMSPVHAPKDLPTNPVREASPVHVSKESPTKTTLETPLPRSPKEDLPKIVVEIPLPRKEEPKKPAAELPPVRPPPLKLKASGIAQRILPLLRGGSITKTEDIKQIVELMAASDDFGGRKYILNALISTKAQPILQRFANSKGLHIFRTWILEARKDPSSETSSEMLSKTIRILKTLPFDLETLRECRLGKVIKNLANDKGVDPAIARQASQLEDQWRQMVTNTVQPTAESNSSSGVSENDQRKKPRISKDDDRLAIYESMGVALPKFTKGKRTTPITAPTVVAKQDAPLEPISKPKTLLTSTAPSSEPTAMDVAQGAKANPSPPITPVDSPTGDPSTGTSPWKSPIATAGKPGQDSLPGKETLSLTLPQTEQGLQQNTAASQESISPPLPPFQRPPSPPGANSAERQEPQSMSLLPTYAIPASPPMAEAKALSPPSHSPEASTGFSGSSSADPARVSKPKKVVRFKADHELVAIRYIEPRSKLLELQEEGMDDDSIMLESGLGNEDVDMVDYHREQRQIQMQQHGGTDVTARSNKPTFMMTNKRLQSATEGEYWRPPQEILLTNNNGAGSGRGNKSTEKLTQERRETETLSAIYFQIAYIPPSPAEPDPESEADWPSDLALTPKPIILFEDTADHSTVLLNSLNLLTQMVSTNNVNSNPAATAIASAYGTAYGTPQYASTNPYSQLSQYLQAHQQQQQQQQPTQAYEDYYALYAGYQQNQPGYSQAQQSVPTTAPTTATAVGNAIPDAETTKALLDLLKNQQQQQPQQQQQQPSQQAQQRSQSDYSQTPYSYYYQNGQAYSS